METIDCLLFRRYKTTKCLRYNLYRINYNVYLPLLSFAKSIYEFRFFFCLGMWKSLSYSQFSHLDFQNEKNEAFNITDFGILLDPNSTEKSINKKFGIRKGSYGQKVLLKQVSPNKTNGYYTCIFITACGSLIGKFLGNIWECRNFSSRIYGS